MAQWSAAFVGVRARGKSFITNQGVGGKTEVVANGVVANGGGGKQTEGNGRTVMGVHLLPEGHGGCTVGHTGVSMRRCAAASFE